jgi:hypothetical protein
MKSFLLTAGIVGSLAFTPAAIEQLRLAQQYDK